MQFRDLRRQYKELKTSIDLAVMDVINSGCFISGPQVKTLEEELAGYVGVKHCVSCANGTDAISIMLIANGIGKAGGGSEYDVVFVPDFTFFSTGECVATCGAIPIFVDVDSDTYNIDAEALDKTVIEVLSSERRLKPKAVIAVDLFGLPADYDALSKICKKYGLLLLEDGAQGFGGRYHGRLACSFGGTSITSFFPAKPLGCYGDGGAIFTDDDDIAQFCRSIAVHGKDMKNPDDPSAKYNNIRFGMNSRLDTIQAAILSVKLKAFRECELDSVNNVSKLYRETLSDVEGLALPRIPSDAYSSWAQYTVKLPDGIDRNVVQQRLRDDGIPTMVYYARPMHAQRAFSGMVSSTADCPNTEYLCNHVLCLPIFPYMTDDEIYMVAKSVKMSLK